MILNGMIITIYQMMVAMQSLDKLFLKEYLYLILKNRKLSNLMKLKNIKNFILSKKEKLFQLVNLIKNCFFGT